MRIAFLIGIFLLPFSFLLSQDTILLYGDTIRVGELEWDMQKDWQSKRKLIAEDRELYGDHVRILLTYHRNRMVSEIIFGYIDKEEGFVKHGPARYYYDSGHLKSKRTFVEGKLQGKGIDFFKDGKIETRAFFKDDSLNGHYESFYADGTKAEEGNYIANVIDGRYLAWYNTAELKWIEHWKNGQKEGTDSTFYETGKLESAIPFRNGVEDGSAFGFHRNGKIWTEWIYEKGRLIEVSFIQNSSGNPLDVGTFFKGEGWLNVYDENGLIREKIRFHDGYEQKRKRIKN